MAHVPAAAAVSAREALHRWARHLGRGHCPGRLYRVSWYPGLVDAEGAGAAATAHVCGDVYELLDPARILPILDAYEGCTPADPSPHPFRRVRRRIVMDDGRRLDAWVYLYQGPLDEATCIASGDFTMR